MRRTTKGAVAMLATVAMTAPVAAAAQPRDRSPETDQQRQALDLGIQVAEKGTTGKKSATGELGLNPWLANLADQTEADYATWRAIMKQGARKRAASPRVKALRREAFAGSPTAALPPAVVHDEEEPSGSVGFNDSHPDAEPVAEFGTRRAKSPRVRILGELTEVDAPDTEEIDTAPEDNGAIGLATESGITGTGSVTTASVLGDGPHGPDGTDSNDFDVVSLEVDAGRTISADTEGTPIGLDTVLALYDADGTPVATDDDGGTGLLSSLSWTAPESGTYYVLVAGYSTSGPLPADPFDSGSGSGGADTGDYRLTIGAQRFDTDYYAIRLRPGDVIGSVGKGSATGLAMRIMSGQQRVGGVQTDASFLYPPTSPLPGGGNTTIAYVAEEPGWYTLQVTGGTGAYDVGVEGFRAGTERDRGRTQTVLLDFDPGRVNTGTWGGPGVRDVTPYAAFAPQWGISRTEGRRLENRTLRVVRRNIQREVEVAGLNTDVNVEVLNARQHPELIGQENVSRIYVAGTIAQTDLPTIGVAQYIDPGNYGHQDEAIVLLDVLSAPAGPISSLNTFMDDSSDRMSFVSSAVGNVIAHEIGHTIGSFHTDNADDIGNMMDSGGANFADNLYGVGPDGIGGTEDDANVRFVTDTYAPVEGFTGLEDTLNVTAWAYAGR